MHKSNIKAVLNSQRPDSKLQFPLRIRTTINRIVKYYPTGIMLLAEQWDGEKVIVHANRVLLNTVIRKKIIDIEKELLEFNLTGEDGAMKIKAVNLSFAEYAKGVVKKMASTQAKVTITHKKSYLNKFIGFAPRIKLKDVNAEVLRKFEDYCKHIGNNNNTVWSGTKFIKTINNYAVTTDKLFTAPVHAGFKGTKYIAPIRITLTPAEIDRIELFANDINNAPKLLNTANWFLFSCYCGLRYGDMSRFVDFNNDKILIQTGKTNDIVSIYATKKLIEIRTRISTGIFSNVNTNDYLKIIAVACKINKKVTFHLARHTFAVQFLERGGSMEGLSKTLGHSTIKTTEIYGKISTKRADAEMKKIWDEE